MSANLTKLERPFDIEQFEDGGAYALPKLDFFRTHLFAEIAAIDAVVIKTPSERGSHDFDKYVKGEQGDSDDIRPIEEDEKWTSLMDMCQSFPAIGRLVRAFKPDYVYYLFVHKLQQERLRKRKLLALPETRFVIIQQPALRFFSSTSPAIVQQRISGTRLWDMYDHDNDCLDSAYGHLIPVLDAQLRPLLDSELRDHIDWNIQNFVFNEAEQRLYYVDTKPSLLFAKSHNEHNITGIRNKFLK